MYSSSCYRFLLSVFLAGYLSFFSVAINAKTFKKPFYSLGGETTQINNTSLQKMFTRVEILQRRNQDFQNRIETLENTNQALTERLKEISIEFDSRIEDLNLKFNDFKKEIKSRVSKNNKKKSSQTVGIVIDLNSQEIYRKGIVAISLEKYQQAIDLLHQFLSQVNPKAKNLIFKAKYWTALSLSKLNQFNESYQIFFELEQALGSAKSKQKQIIDLNQVRLEMVRALVGLNQTKEASGLINRFIKLNITELTSLLKPIQEDLKNKKNSNNELDIKTKTEVKSKLN